MVHIASPTFNSFSLQDSNYITSTINYRTIPKRELEVGDIARKPGKKLLSHEFGAREITLNGYVIADDGNDLIDKIDDLHENVSNDDLGVLTIDTNRQIEAVVSDMDIPDPHYSQSMVPFSVKFYCPDPFYYGPQLTVALTVVSGTSEPHTQSISMTVSGTVFAEPSITYTAPGDTGVTTLSGIYIEYESTGETTTWSGGDAPLNYGQAVRFDYSNQIILEDNTEVSAAGQFSRWEPGDRNITVTYSGMAPGGTLDIAYRPRYL